MKRKLAFLALLLFLGAGSLKSQDIPPPNPGLYINIVSGYSIEFVFDEIDEYINGIMNAGQQTFIRIGAIYDWKLQFKADQMIFTGTNDPAHQMELNNVGVVVNSIGTNQDDGSNITNNAKTVPVALESSDVTLLTKGYLTNKGYGIENSFTMNWEMGTRNGNMNQTRMLDQMLAADSYTLNIILTLSVY
ncbi:MAG: hypothetical protein M0Q51_03505 [Bacteroidales bacterium]|nr:hypothetical protein [Bacteroidales bacterium]